MKYTTQFRKSWMDVFAPDNLLQKSQDPHTPVFIDIGGGIGTDVIEFRRRYPNTTGRVILQELPAVIAAAKERHPDLESKVSVVKSSAALSW